MYELVVVLQLGAKLCDFSRRCRHTHAKKTVIIIKILQYIHSQVKIIPFSILTILALIINKKKRAKI